MWLEGSLFRAGEALGTEEKLESWGFLGGCKRGNQEAGEGDKRGSFAGFVW